jgi:hypothetical protein
MEGQKIRLKIGFTHLYKSITMSNIQKYNRMIKRLIRSLNRSKYIKK